MRFLLLLTLLAGLGACADRSQSPTTPSALNIGTSHTVFAATTREETTGGQFGFERANKLSLLELTVSIPPSHTPGELEFSYANPDPETQFVMAGRHKFESASAFQAKINVALAKLPREHKEITVFIHGYNATQAETAFRAAQLATDVEQPGVTIIYSWPSQGKALGYVYDNDSMLFARDGLEQLIRSLDQTDANRVIVVAHSLGSALLMETLRQIDLQSPGSAANLVGGVILISPDLDIKVFRGQMEHLHKVPDPFIVFVSKKDAALNISSKLRGRGRTRLGNIENIEEIRDLPIEIVDTTAFSKDAGSSHFVPATSPAMIAMMNKPKAINDTFDSENRTFENIIRGNVIDGGIATRLVLTPGIDGAE